MAEDIHKQIERERRAAHPGAADTVPLYRRYAEGDQDATLTAEQKAILGSAAKHPYADNVADLVIAAWSSRLTLTGFAVGDGAVRGFLDGCYARNQLGDLSYDVNYATGRDGNHALILRWLADDPPPVEDPMAETPEAPLPGRAGGRPTAHAEDWWDGKTGVWVAYDDHGRPAYAVKDFAQWIVGGDGLGRDRERRTVYFPDRIERYIKAGNGWQPYPLSSEGGETHVADWTKRDGTPLGIPVVHFLFPRFGRRRYGISELAGGLLANQDHLNDAQQDLAAAARLLGYQILWATGAEFKEEPVLQPGALLHTKKESARFGAIPAGDLDQLGNARDGKLATIARNSSTPVHIIKGGDWPAGVALVQADKPLIVKVERMAKVLGPAWVLAAHRMTEMANAFGNAGLDEDALITARFADPEQPDALARAELAAARERIRTRQGLIEIGYSEQDAERILQERREGARASAEAFGRAFDAGEGGEEDGAS